MLSLSIASLEQITHVLCAGLSPRSFEKLLNKSSFPSPISLQHSYIFSALTSSIMSAAFLKFDLSSTPFIAGSFTACTFFSPANCSLHSLFPLVKHTFLVVHFKGTACCAPPIGAVAL